MRKSIPNYWVWFWTLSSMRQFVLHSGFSFESMNICVCLWSQSYPHARQGLNFVVRLLLALVDEEHAFWLLAAIVEDMRLPDFYSRMPVQLPDFILRLFCDCDLVFGAFNRFILANVPSLVAQHHGLQQWCFLYQIWKLISELVRLVSLIGLIVVDVIFVYALCTHTQTLAGGYGRSSRGKQRSARHVSARGYGRSEEWTRYGVCVFCVRPVTWFLQMWWVFMSYSQSYL